MGVADNKINLDNKRINFLRFEICFFSVFIFLSSCILEKYTFLYLLKLNVMTKKNRNN